MPHIPIPGIVNVLLMAVPVLIIFCYVLRYALRRSLFRTSEIKKQGKRLNHPDTRKRLFAVTALRAIQDPRVISLLVRALQDRDAGVRLAAVASLGERGTREAVEPLLGLMRSHNMQQSVLAALERIGDARAALPLAMLLDQIRYIDLSASDVRLPAKTRDKQAVEEFLQPIYSEFMKCFGDAKAAETELFAIMGNLTTHDAGMGLYNLNKQVATTRAKIVQLLGVFQVSGTADMLIRTLCDPYPNVRTAAAQALSKLGEPEWASVVDGSVDDYERLGCTRDKRLTAVMISMLGSRIEETRRNALQGLGAIQDTAAVPHILRAFEDENPSVRTQALRAIAKYGEKYAAEPLMRIFRNDKEMRNTAIGLLDRIHSPRTLKPMLAALGSADGDVRKGAAKVLGKLGDASAVLPLVQALQDDSSDVRNAAAVALGLLKDISTAEPLLDSYIAGTYAAAESLSQLFRAHTKGPAGESALQAVRNSPIATRLLGELENDNVNRVKNAILLLRLLKENRAATPLIRLLGHRPDIRMEAAKSLAELGAPQWKEYATGTENDYARLNRSKDPQVDAAIKLAAENLTLDLQPASNDSDSWNARKNAASMLIEIAKAHPDAYKFSDLTIQAIRKKHTDSYNDNSSDCHDDGHSDTGIGLDFTA